jgi:four helix bundle protein
MFDFQNLIVYKKAKRFHRECKGFITNNKLDRYVRDQLGRASFSIVLNIAEGSSKFSNAHRKTYFVAARGSVFECVAILDLLQEDNTMDSDDFNNYLTKADELSRILYSMIKNLS